MNKEKKVVKDVKSFVVDRKTWYRGKGTDRSCLLNNANRMCCLGFYALACGLDKKVIRNIPDPSHAVKLTEGEAVQDINEKSVTRKSDVRWSTKLINKNDIYHDNTYHCYDLMSVNDDDEITEEVRENELTKLFKKIGIQVTFK
jgi:hypothetical protein